MLGPPPPPRSLSLKRKFFFLARLLALEDTIGPALEGTIGSELAPAGVGRGPRCCMCAGSPLIAPPGDGPCVLVEDCCVDVELPWRDRANAFILAFKPSGKRPLVGGGAGGRLALDKTPICVDEADMCWPGAWESDTDRSEGILLGMSFWASNAGSLGVSCGVLASEELREPGVMGLSGMLCSSESLDLGGAGSGSFKVSAIEEPATDATGLTSNIRLIIVRG